MDAILKRMQAARANKSLSEDAPIHPELLRAQQEDIRRRQELVQYRERATRHLKKLMEDDSLKFMQYPPMDVFHRNVVASLADEFGLVSHEFGEEEIDRYVIVYKPAHAPSPDEVARLTMKHTMKIADETVEKIIAAPEMRLEPQQPKKKAAKVVEELDDDPVPAEQLRAVGTVKRVRRNAADVMEEVRLKRRMEKIAAPSEVDEEIDSLFVVAAAAAAASSSASTAGAVEWDEEEEF